MSGSCLPALRLRRLRASRAPVLESSEREMFLLLLLLFSLFAAETLRPYKRGVCRRRRMPSVQSNIDTWRACSCLLRQPLAHGMAMMEWAENDSDGGDPSSARVSVRVRVRVKIRSNRTT